MKKLMVMRNIKEGEPTTPVQIELKKNINVRFFYDEDGNEWYSSQKLFSTDTIKVAFDEKNIIRCVHSDVSAIYPENMSIAEVENTTANRRADNRGGWQYINGEIVRREFTRDELIAAAEEQKTALLAAAAVVIAPLQDAVDLEIATNDENAALAAWKKYRVQLNRVDTSASPDIDWPTAPTA